MYEVDTEAGRITPDALADLGDNDNYEHLCLSESAIPLRVRAVAGVAEPPVHPGHALPELDQGGRQGDDQRQNGHENLPGGGCEPGQCTTGRRQGGLWLP